MTTFSRLALVIQGKIKPCNWIERAFAALAEAASSVLPSVSNADRGKFLGVNKTNNNLGWKTIRQVPDFDSDDIGKSLSVVGSGETEVVTRSVTVIESQTPNSTAGGGYRLALGTYDLSEIEVGETEVVTRSVTDIESQTPNSTAGGGYRLALGTYDLSEIEVGDTVDVTINGTEKECEVYAGYGDRKDIRYYTDETHYAVITNEGGVWNEGSNINIATAVISATMTTEVEVPIPAVEWSANANIAIITATLSHGDYVVEESYSDMVAIVESGKVPVLFLGGMQLAIPQHLPQNGEPNFEWACSYFNTGNTWTVTTIVVELNEHGCFTDYIEYTITPVE